MPPTPSHLPANASTLHASKAATTHVLRQRHGGRLVALCFVPLLGWVLLTMLLALVQPWQAFPRQLAPGAGLAWQGLAVSAGVTAAVVLRLWRGVDDAGTRRLLAGLALLGGLLAWPVLTLGPLPSINGIWLADTHTTAMRLEKLSTSPQKGRRAPYHWAHLQPLPGAGAVASGPPPLPAGRLLVDGLNHADWAARQVHTVQVTHHRGLLGARVVTRVAGWREKTP